VADAESAGARALSSRFPPPQAWQGLPLPAPPSFEGCGEYQECADLDGRQVHAGQTSSGDSPDLALTVRRFAPFQTFGGKFEGDADSRHIPVSRDGSGGFTSEPTATARTTMTIGVEGSTPTEPSGHADLSRHPLFGTGRATVYVTSGSHSTSSVDGMIEAKSAGSNPLLLRAPDIDTDMQIAYQLSPGKLALDGSVWGDTFPNAELFASDASGQAVMLGEFQTTYGAELGPFHLCFDAPRTPTFELINFHAEIPVDPDGNFAGTPSIKVK
jgi:hypothetical protein